ncbi:proteasome activator complex subunit 3 [Trichuris trichiura]|uniref:Proteasome activator complex subunit 3 n=1 Tax=Trichuris trichiura TaxID=36087 RepID=A0A077Z378_TRITR|nr:proteasome activator complex subunit 3 [Trichuris trichiura]
MSSTSSSMTAALDEWKTDWKKSTEKLVLEDFPKKVVEINELLQGPLFSMSRLEEVPAEMNVAQFINSSLPQPENNDTAGAPSKKTKVNPVDVVGCIRAPIACNRMISDLTNIVKPIVREAVENVNKVKMWILFLIPRIEDGNNFGVQIQEDTLAEVRTVEAEASSCLEQISHYLYSRGRLVCKCAKYPHVEDYQEGVRDLDEKEFLKLRLFLVEVRNHYSSLHDMIVKNLDKIKTPRTAHSQHLY